MLLCADIKSACGNDMKWYAMTKAGFCVLSALLSMAAHGGMSDAVSASGPPPRTLMSPSSAATPPSPDILGTVPDAPAVSPGNPNAMPMPAPASTDNYAGSAEDSSAYDQLSVLPGSRRSISFFTTA